MVEITELGGIVVVIDSMKSHGQDDELITQGKSRDNDKEESKKRARMHAYRASLLACTMYRSFYCEL